MCFAFLFLGQPTTDYNDHPLLEGCMIDGYVAIGCFLIVSIDPMVADGRYMGPRKSMA